MVWRGNEIAGNLRPVEAGNKTRLVGFRLSVLKRVPHPLLIFSGEHVRALGLGAHTDLGSILASAGEATCPKGSPG